MSQRSEPMSERQRNGYSRRDVLRGGAAAVASSSLVLSPSARSAALAQGTPAATSADFDWKRYEGESIEVLLAVSPRADLLVEHQPEFEELTGITANTDVVPEQQQRQKQVIEFTSGNPSFDVTAVSWHVQKGLFGKGGFLLDLREFLDDPEMTAPDYDFADFSQA